ncbi:protein-(glutamine-N5) methyltransferase, release factor-specific [candidate division WOR-1 bacterium RIFOXYB2_FULL_42_35]|uniref:Release factor glutamine methyltransferase n=1 Tax=candidate division WOR-1 bacterium RIFOXYC2_FULL_41_25 TaxID=1802586 RepID=A0A1F4TP60_UNCSA|nr:MAG: protein-(glutamine-N5) methyltransferase, release factor-specific [candidate division WOR-1 bacterium RIFOXYA2_FULL_41_14]OGC25095.1 MAG: protein-(glutamine-N5) methyltransferase, release factor-specific [candidate division WOR-1 bacterium RIFOXYB2_FULL_42_35]OGC34495.1 MAG: protein-(glutamine-N5) methyltransferase, release factor-specific [candidate division WOR-1 bacterium RIFOXYC2_FULL_41_25]OGC43233.1 MAG: protein-(glutamine-N5) methyltransferase, release factor-specific [candidate d
MTETWTITKLLDWTTDYFKKAQIEWPHLEAEILLAHSLGLKRIELYTQHERALSKEELANFKLLIKRRSLHEPIAYITGYQPFMVLDIIVDQNVLIPRPETEQMVEIVIELVTRNPQLVTIADIGTGSGCIAVTLAKYLPQVKVIAIDSAPQAIAVAQKNADKHQVSNRCQFIIGNLLEPLTEKIDLIISNPPYIPTAIIETLETNVKDFEPRQALDGERDGLDYIRRLIKESPQHLKENGQLILEFGIDQAEEIKRLAQQSFREIKIIRDASGKARFLLAQL